MEVSSIWGTGDPHPQVHDGGDGAASVRLEWRRRPGDRRRWGKGAREGARMRYLGPGDKQGRGKGESGGWCRDEGGGRGVGGEVTEAA